MVEVLSGGVGCSRLAPEQHSGKAFYRVEDGAMVGESVVNSRVRRSKSFPADRVFGDENKIDSSRCANPDVVYGEARIECRGDHIQTWINGVKAAYLKDGMTWRGLIALRVHQIGDGTKKPASEEIRWRNIRIKEL